MEKILAAAEIIKTETIEFLAKKHNCTADTIISAMKSGKAPTLEAQFDELVKLAIDKAIEMHNAGEIALA
jgi:xanthine dehydrogenase molybdopterin-binding subunit B